MEMKGRDKARSKSRSLDLDPDSYTTFRTDLGNIEEDRQIASLAVQFVVSGARKGNVHLCSRIAELLRENKRLHRTVEAQRVHIEELRVLCSLSTAGPVGPLSSPTPGAPSPSPFPCLLPSTSHLPYPPLATSPTLPLYLPSLSGSSPTTSSHSCSSGRGSLSSSTTPPCLPRLGTPHPGALLTPCRRQPSSLPCVEENEIPSMPHSPQQRRESDAHGPEHDGWSKATGKRRGGLLPAPAPETVGYAQALKKRVLRQSASCEAERKEVEEMERKENDEHDTTALYREGLDPNSTTRRHRLQVNDRVTLRDRRGVDEKRKRGKEKRRGAVRFIGPLQNTDSTEVYIGVELDTPCGENNGSIHGYRYFRCEPNHGAFTTISGIRKLSSHSRHTDSPLPQRPSQGATDSCSGSSTAGSGLWREERGSEMEEEWGRRKGKGKGEEGERSG
ncbi:kinesin-like protein KIF13B [Osmerus eperlanus]|uniref:kinesin-like protein KIF13B n=1 Tax=Osmerus eperlanus TaxID=29151 RepID=UPI002E1165D0